MIEKDIFVSGENDTFIPAPAEVLSEESEGIYLVVISDTRGGTPDPFFTVYWYNFHEELPKGYHRKSSWSTMFDLDDVRPNDKVREKWNEIKNLIEEQLK